ncbi:MAG: hypothetical protein ACOYNF_20885 [Rhodoferax sp.]
MNKPQTPASANLLHTVDRLNRLRDALVKLSLALHDLQFDLDDDARHRAHQRGAEWIVKACTPDHCGGSA